ncbi:carbohydrate-binding domain-containing protein [Oribacterium sp. C9]|uniref:carbohydrate-binding domain-containing protein n=1 Tax=Oribacterium sp. C9 TaxID=1943579 RepID=UPI00143CB5F6|nr:carbohydrate-binding domain-containing protein [Oribacterium sp. C9]
MRKNNSKYAYIRSIKGMAMALSVAGTVVFAAGCSNSGTVSEQETGGINVSGASDEGSSSDSTAAAKASSGTKSTNGEIAITVNDGNINVSGQNSDSVKVSGTTITITKAGTYRLSGTLTEGQILVEAGDKDDVQLILDGFSISNSETAPIYVKTSGNFFLEPEAGTENLVEDKREAASGSTSTEEIPDAAIYSKSDLYIIGTGALTVRGGYSDGIHGKDLLMVSEAVTLDITATEHGINGKDSLEIQAGTISITSGEDALHSKGDVIISDGTLQISAEDDGIHAENEVRIDGGNVDIVESYEGLEALKVTINGGNISVSSSDDGINSAGGADSSGGMFDVTEGAAISINGGTVYITAAGDGIDSNGDVVITGGEIYVDGPSMDGNASLDYNGTATITGGSFSLTGSSGMFQSFSGESTQAQIIVYYSERQAAGTEITVTDSEGKVIYVNADSQKEFTVFLLSSPELKAGETYTVKTGDQEATVTIEGLTGTAGERSADMMGGGMGGPGGPGGREGQGRPGGFGGSGEQGVTGDRDGQGIPNGQGRSGVSSGQGAPQEQQNK